MQGRPLTHQIDHPYQGTAAGGTLDIDDLVVPPNSQVHRFADALVQGLHEGQGDLPQVDAGLHQVAQLQQADAQAVGARLLALDETGLGHGRQDAVGSGRVELGALGQLLQAGRLRGGGQGVEQGHHALDDLDGVAVLRLFVGLLFLHFFGCVLRHIFSLSVAPVWGRIL